MDLKEFRLKEKTLAEVASDLNVTIQPLYRYERGSRRINIEQVLLLSQLYNCTAEEIINAQLNSCP